MLFVIIVSFQTKDVIKFVIKNLSNFSEDIKPWTFIAKCLLNSHIYGNGLEWWHVKNCLGNCNLHIRVPNTEIDQLFFPRTMREQFGSTIRWCLFDGQRVCFHTAVWNVWILYSWQVCFNLYPTIFELSVWIWTTGFWPPLSPPSDDIGWNLINSHLTYRSPHGFSDTDMCSMILQLKREEDNVCGHRGLLPSSEQQTYSFLAPKNLR